ncbi:MAG TPA: class I SAM-dependent methyltransferase [Chitinivibrionales bacterium]|nr:class I SAM-dependent methyltransferase [Chitinivibrionales bacterium]
MSRLQKKAEKIGQKNFHAFNLWYIVNTFFPNAKGLSVADIGAYDGWMLSYNGPEVNRRIAIDFDDFFKEKCKENSIEFICADVEKGPVALPDASCDIVLICSTLEHLSNPEEIASEIYRILKKNGIVFVTVPDIEKYKFAFFNDITHKRPFTKRSLEFLFACFGFSTLVARSYNHDLFTVSFLFPRFLQPLLQHASGAQLLYIGRK